jgi:hypothetical protein
LALGGRRFNNINNNQIEDGGRRGKAGSEHVGRMVACRLGWDINQPKKIERWEDPLP